jgi:peptide/nickel transport system permease protein
MNAALTTPTLATAAPTQSARSTGWRRLLGSLTHNRMATAGLLVLVAMSIAAVLAPLVAPYDPSWQERGERLVAPMTVGEDTGRFYVMGTDNLGRDILSRVIYGARVSLLIGFLSVAVATPLGVVLGLVAGYSRRWVDDVIMRIADIQLAFPFILLAMVIVSVLGPSIRNLILVLAISSWVIYARVVRGQVLRLKETEFVQGATTIGCSSGRIVYRHLLRPSSSWSRSDWPR